MVLSTSPTRGGEPVGIALLACQARELAFELLELAEQADREGRIMTVKTPARRRSPKSSSGCCTACACPTSAGPRRR